jgi:hypothetical protein
MTYPTDQQDTSTVDTDSRSWASTDYRPLDPSSLAESIPGQGVAPPIETVPGAVPFDRPTAPAGLSTLASGEAPRGRSAARALSIAIPALVALIGVIVTIAVTHPVARPITSSGPSANQSAATAPQVPSVDSSATAAADRAQLSAAYSRLDQAGQQFVQASNGAAKNGSEQAYRNSVTTFRAAVDGYDAEVRGMAFPAGPQAVVNTQLLPATDRLIADLDQAADPDPATVLQIKPRAVQDAQALDSATQQVYDGLGS